MTRPPILLVGKGPSARVVTPPWNFHVAALNGAITLCPDRVDWLFVNDIEAFDEIPDKSLDQVCTLVLPTGVHVNGGRKVISTHELPARLWDRVQIRLYRLPTHDRIQRGRGGPDAFGVSPHVPAFGVVQSVGESSVAWLLHCGYREFYTVGIDAEAGYSPAFKHGRQTQKPATWFAENVRRIYNRVTDAGGTITPFNARDHATRSPGSGQHMDAIRG